MLKNPEQSPPPQERKEYPGDSLRIARILMPRDENDVFALIVGIPFEPHQLEKIDIVEDGVRKPLLKIMETLDLIGETKGVPHLSVGGKTTQTMLAFTGGLSTVTSYLDSQATRAYLVGGGFGVQGAGLVKYQEGVNLDFGLGAPFMRNNGEYNIGGGVESSSAKWSAHFGNSYWLSSGIYFGKPRFARVFGVYDYQSWIETDSLHGGMQKTSLVVREDGKRGVGRKRLNDEILSLIPWMCDDFSFPVGSFEPDGHNVFEKNSSLIFTDYESIDSLCQSYDSFMMSLAKAWFFDDCRKNFRLTCTRFGLTQTGQLHEAGFEEILLKVEDVMKKSSLRSELKDPIILDLRSRNRKAVERYAIAGLMASRSLGRLFGRRMLESFVQNMVNDDSYTLLRLEDVFSYIQSLQIENLPKKTGHTGEEVGFSRNELGQLCFEIDMETFGLPVAEHIRIPVTIYDIYKVWPYDEKAKQLKKFRAPDNLGHNPFENVPTDIIKKTIYSTVASALHYIYGQTVDQGASELENEVSLTYEELPIEAASKLKGIVFVIDSYENFKLAIQNVDSGLSIKITGDISKMNLSQINKIAYTIHAYCMQATLRQTISDKTVTISGIFI